MLSFIVPAHDEELVILDTLRAIQYAVATVGCRHEIIVVDDGSIDETAAIARRAGARVVTDDVRHIAKARNAGAAVAVGDVLLFVDADTVIDAGVVRAAIGVMNSGAIGGGAEFRFDEPTPDWVKRLLPFIGWLGRKMRIASGCFLFCSRQSFEAVHGFDEQVYAAEEIILSRALKQRGRFVILPNLVVTSARKLRTHSGRELFAMVLRMACAGSGALNDRKLLSLWYGARRRDPARKA